MLRNVRILLLFAAAFNSTALSRIGVASADVQSKTNFVVLLCDDLGYGDLGCFGHPMIKSPNLDRLAAEGLKLTACYAGAPVCSPSRVGMLTGRTPNRAGVYDWIPDGSPMHLRAGEITLPKLLQEAGYATCHVGKWHANGKFNRPDQPQPGDHGFDYWFSTQNNALPNHHNPLNFVRNGTSVGPLEGYSSTIIVNEALAWLDKRPQDKPFCLFVWFHSPHEIVATAEEYTAMYPQAKNKDEAEYFGNVTQMDHEAGRLLKRLDELHLRDNTFVFFSSDNGPETLNRYRTANHSWGSPGPLRGMKLHMYEGGIRVPGMIRWPGKTKPGQVSDEPVCFFDLLPTCCAIAGTKPPAERALDGTSILPLFEGRSIVRASPLYWQYDKAISPTKVALRDGDWKLLADGDLQSFELYNVRTDIGEKNDLAANEPARVADLKQKLLKLHAEIKAEGPIWPASSPQKAKK
jgi:arylsulfatase A